MQLQNLLENSINSYRTLQLGGKLVVCPYFINTQRKRDLRALVGKGTPSEIVLEANIWAKLKGINLDDMSAAEIKEFLSTKSLGIDCSGFIVHVLNDVYKAIKKRNIWQDLKIERKGIRGKIAYMLRPVENLGAEIITNEENADKVEISDVQILDLIRSKAKKNNGHHIMLVTGIDRDQTGKVTMITYTHSSPYYGEENGIKTGQIEVTDLSQPLEKQNWLEKDEFGVVHTLEGYLQNPNDNGLRRLKIFKNLEIV